MTVRTIVRQQYQRLIDSATSCAGLRTLSKGWMRTVRKRLIPLTQVTSTTGLTSYWTAADGQETPWFRMDRRPCNCASGATASPLGRGDGG
jgi:hypothetical protein